MKNLITHLSILLLLVISCDKDSERENQLAYQGCDESNLVQESKELNEILIGNWRLTDAACGNCAPNTSFDWVKEKTIVASFAKEGTFSVVENGVEVDRGLWRINETNDWTIIEIEGESYIYFSSLTESAIICDGWLVSDGTPADGLGYFYRKLD
jgi:hypothetical protein